MNDTSVAHDQRTVWKRLSCERRVDALQTTLKKKKKQAYLSKPIIHRSHAHALRDTHSSPHSRAPRLQAFQGACVFFPPPRRPITFLPSAMARESLYRWRFAPRHLYILYPEGLGNRSSRAVHRQRPCTANRTGTVVLYKKSRRSGWSTFFSISIGTRIVHRSERVTGSTISNGQNVKCR